MILLGFEKIKSKLAQSYKDDLLSHAILICGKKGVGKSIFAKKFALEILQAKSDNHPDLLIIQKEENKKEISVEKIREIKNFVSQTSAIAKDKFIIIDSADELSRSASNALLKILEEPNKNNFIILISHSLSKLLPTILSRCQINKIEDLSDEDFIKIVKKNLPRINDEQIKILAEICDKSPAQAIEFGDEIILLYEKFLQSIKNKNIEEELLKIISDKNFNFENLGKIIYFFLKRISLYLSGNIEYFILEEKEIFSNLSFDLEKIFRIEKNISKTLNQTEKLYLDKKLSLVNIFNIINFEYAKEF